MYCDEIRGIFPLLIFPEESIKSDDKIMTPINFHPIWFLSTEGEIESEYVNLIYEGKVYFAKKYQFYSEKDERKANHIEAFFKKIAIILVLPKDMNFYRRIFLKTALEAISKDFKSCFYKIVESEILKEDLIKIPKNESIIKEGEVMKKKIKNILNSIFFRSFPSQIPQECY